MFQEEYYCAGDMALPIRWCAPETLHCTDTIIETKEVRSHSSMSRRSLFVPRNGFRNEIIQSSSLREVIGTETLCVM